MERWHNKGKKCALKKGLRLLKNFNMFRKPLSEYDVIKVPTILYSSINLSRGLFILKLGFTVLFLIFAPSVCATWQIPDTLIVEGKEYSCWDEILEDYFSEENPKPFQMSSDSWCWRGYYATWELRNNSLYLLSLKDCTSGEDIWHTFLKGKTSPLLAVWYSDVLTIPFGNKLGETDLYERVECYVVIDGVVENRYLARNFIRPSADLDKNALSNADWLDATLLWKNYPQLKETDKKFQVRGFYLGEYFYIPANGTAGRWKMRIEMAEGIEPPATGAALEAVITSDHKSGFILHGFTKLRTGAALDHRGLVILQ